MAFELSEALERQLLRELQEAYEAVNREVFRGALIPAIIELGDAESWYGQWRGTSRRLLISRSLVMGRSWLCVVEVLKHEMAHQYVHEVLGFSNEAHGRVFRDVCRRFGIDPAASGLAQTPSDTGVADGRGRSEQTRRLLVKVTKLLELADRASENESHAAMNAAQRLMLRYNIDAGEVLRERTEYRFVAVGRVTARACEWEHLLASLLVEHFFVKAIWVRVYRPTLGKHGRVLELCGAEANLEFARYVHEFLTRTSQELWKQHQARVGTRSDRDRQTFLAGVMIGFREQLDASARVSQQQGLVWLGDQGLDAYFKRRYPHQSSSRIRARGASGARERGKQAGRDIVLRRPVGASEAADRGRLLTA